MKTIDTIEELREFINEQPLSLVFITRPACSVCHSLKPQVEEIVKQYPSITTASVDANEVPQIAGDFSVMTAPVVLLFSEGKELFRKARFVPVKELNQQLAKYNHFINME